MPATVLDVFKGDGYSTTELTAAINKLPYVPGRLGASGLFKHQGVTTLTVLLESKAGKISLIPAKTRGSGATSKRPAEKRNLRPFTMAYLPYDDVLYADDLIGIRAFGQGDVLETLNTKVNDTLEGLRRDHEITHEYHRVGAIQGIVLDADGTTEIFDLFDEFDIVETEIDFALDVTTTDVKAKCEAVSRVIEGALGGVTFKGTTAQVGDGFWDALIGHASVKAAFDRWQDGTFLRTSQKEPDGIRRFEFCGIMFENYRGQVGDLPFIPNDVARFYPIGIPDLFVHYSAPAPFNEAVGTIGQQVYAKQTPMKFDMGIEFLSVSCPAILCTRPEVLVKGVSALPGGSS
jgi:hypothetical protein